MSIDIALLVELRISDEYICGSGVINKIFDSNLHILLDLFYNGGNFSENEEKTR